MKQLFVSAFFLLLASVLTLEAQQTVSLTYSGSTGYSLVERTNLRRYINGKYVGLTSREVRSFISPAEAPRSSLADDGVHWYDGSFYVLEATKSNARETASGIHDSIPSVFSISEDGTLSMYRDNGYPSFRSFPAFTRQKLRVGDAWKATAERAVDPMNKGVFTRMPVFVRYTFEGAEVYKGENVFRIKAIWQTNYGFSNFDRDPKGDDSLKKATGGHKADIIVRAATGEAILISDNVDESFFYADGTKVDLKGTITLFTEYPPAIDHDKLIFALNRIAKAETSAKGAGGFDKPNQPNGTNGTGGEKGGISSAGKNAAAGSPKLDQAEKTPSGDGQNSSWGAKTQNGGGQNSAGEEKPKSAESEIPFGNKKSALSERIASAKGASASSNSQVSSSGDSSSGTDKNNMVFEETPAGIRLSVRDIKFKADSDEVLSSEKSRLDEIAEVLKLAPNSQFLIEGHTAAVGKPAGEQKLSEERARRIATELSKRGIAADKFICKGLGGTKPIASNSTDTGRAKNRRVEITILE